MHVLQTAPPSPHFIEPYPSAFHEQLMKSGWRLAKRWYDEPTMYVLFDPATKTNLILEHTDKGRYKLWDGRPTENRMYYACYTNGWLELLENLQRFYGNCLT